MHAGHAVARVTGPTCKPPPFLKPGREPSHAERTAPSESAATEHPTCRRFPAIAGVPFRLSARIMQPASFHPMQLDSSIAVAHSTQPRRRFIRFLRQRTEFAREFDARRTAATSARNHGGCGHATSMHPRIHLACASSFRCQTTALFRGSSFSRIGCLPTRRSRAGAGQPCPGAAPTRLQTWKMLVGPFVVVHAPVTTRKCTNGIATALPLCRHASACSYLGPAPRLRLFKHPRDESRAPGITPAAKVLPRLEPVSV